MAAALLVSWEGRQYRASAAAHWSVAACIAAGAVATAVLGRGRQRATTAAWLAGAPAAWRAHPPAYRRAWVVWLVLAAAVVGWDAWSFAAQAHPWPTLSDEIGRLTRHPAGRSLLFAAWLAAGVAVAGGARTRRRRR